MEKRALYIMISRTDGGMGRLIRCFTRYEYNHVSLTLDPEFRSWVSFARYYCDAPLYGGFIVETAERYLAKGKSVKVKLFRLDISEKRYQQLAERFSAAGSPESGLIYNTYDALASIVGQRVKIRNAYTCLGFASEILEKRFRSIKELDEYLSSLLIYEGELSCIAYDNGSRDDMYFTSCGLANGTRKTLRNLARLSYRAVRG